MAHQPDFGRRLRQARQDRGLSQRDLAGDAVSASYISLLEAGTREPTLDVIVSLADRLQMTVAHLTGRKLHRATDRGGMEESLILAEALAVGAADTDDYSQAATMLQSAFDDARRGDNELTALAIGIRLQHVLAVLNRYEDRVALLTDLVALPAAAGSAEVEGMLRGDLAAALRDSGNLSDARTAALAALDLAHRSSPHNSGQRIKLLGVIVSVLVELGEANHAEIYVKDMLQAADEAQSPGLLGRAHWVAANTYAQTGQGELARKHLAEAHRALTSPTMPLREWMRFCRSSAAVLLDVNDDLPEIDRWLLNAETSARMLAMPIEQHRVAAVRARYFLAAGQPQQAYDTVAPLLERTCEGLSPPELIRLRLLHARAMAELGRPDDAAESMRTLAIEAEALGALPLAVEVWRHIDALRTSRS